MTAVLVLLGGAVGAAARYLTDVSVRRRHSAEFPWGTFTVNMVGCFVLGLVAAAGSAWVLTLVGTGFCGAFTTFSTFGYESVRLREHGETGAAWANVAGSVVVGMGAAVLGWWLGSSL